MFDIERKIVTQRFSGKSFFVTANSTAVACAAAGRIENIKPETTAHHTRRYNTGFQSNKISRIRDERY